MPSSDYLDSLVARGIIGGDALERLRQTMTHEAEQPNAAQPYLDTARRAAGIASEFIPGYGRGLQGVADRQGVDMPMPDWMRSNPVQRTLQNPDNVAAMGMANPTPKIVGGMAAKINADIAAGLSRQAIADKYDIGKATVGRYLAKSGQTTAAAENPSMWTPETEQQLMAWRTQGVSHPEIARRLDTSVDAVESKIYALRDAGKLDYQRRVSPPLLQDPQKRADLIRLANDNESQGNIASYFFGGPGGKHPRRQQIGRFIRQIQEEGTPEEREALKNYTPQGVTKGATPAGRTPTLAATPKTTAGPAPDPEASQDWVKMLRAAGLAF